MSWQDVLNAYIWTFVFPIQLLIDQVPLFGQWPWLGYKNKDMHVSVPCMFIVYDEGFFSPQENVFMILHYMHFFLHRRRVHILQHDIFLVKSCMFTLAVSLNFNLTRKGQHIQRWRHLVTSKHFRIKVIFQCQWTKKLLICHIGQLMDIDHSM